MVSKLTPRAASARRRRQGLRRPVVGPDVHDAAGGRIINPRCHNVIELLHIPGHGRPRYTQAIVRRWWLGLEGLIPPPVGALAGRSWAGRYRGRGLSWWVRQ